MELLGLASSKTMIQMFDDSDSLDVHFESCNQGFKFYETGLSRLFHGTEHVIVLPRLNTRIADVLRCSNQDGRMLARRLVFVHEMVSHSDIPRDVSSEPESLAVMPIVDCNRAYTW